jgi:hypothetical protein
MAKGKRRRKAASRRRQSGVKIIKVEVVDGGAGYPVPPMITFSPGYPLGPAATFGVGGASSGPQGAGQVWVFPRVGKDFKPAPPLVPVGAGKTPSKQKRARSKATAAVATKARAGKTQSKRKRPPSARRRAS